MSSQTEVHVEVNEYELVYILQPKLDDDGIQAAMDKINDVITNGGGEVVSTERWGMRKLAYPIKRHFEGYYVLQRLSMPPAVTHPLERAFRLSENVIRHMVLRTDE